MSVCGEGFVVVVALSSKVTMVMMTLSAFLHRKACRFSTGEFFYHSQTCSSQNYIAK